MGSFSIWHWLVVVVVLAVFVLPGILYTLTLQRAMSLVPESMRSFAPGLVWLLFVPLVNIVWIFFVVIGLRDGYARMEQVGRLRAPTTAGYGVGLGMAICGILTAIPLLGIGFGIATLVLWIMHWMQVSEATRQVYGAGWDGSPGVAPAHLA